MASACWRVASTAFSVTALATASPTPVDVTPCDAGFGWGGGMGVGEGDGVGVGAACTCGAGANPASAGTIAAPWIVATAHGCIVASGGSAQAKTGVANPGGGSRTP